MPFTSFNSGNPVGAGRITNVNLKLYCNSFDVTFGAPVLGPIELPDGVVGSPYNAQNWIDAPCVPTPITYSITSGSLPPGLSLSSPDGLREWAITGTPTSSGTYTFTLKAQNSLGSDSVSITVSILASASAVPNYGFSG